MTTLAIQRRLTTLGYDPGPLDGIRGRLTIRALKAFQADRALAVDGIAGPRTLEKLFGHAGEGASPAASAPQQTPWYEEALRLKGTREAAGPPDNPLIIRWAERLGIGYTHDSVAWCGLFAAHCIASALPDEPLPTNPLGARNWLRFGTETEPTLGAVLVFWRGSKAGWQGHVGFYAGEDGTGEGGAYHVLGGNQSDRVSIARVARNRLLGTRWPKSAPAPEARVLRRGAAEGRALSINEA